MILDVLKNSYLITSLVLVMMMMIEYINVGTSGRIFQRLSSSKPRQVLFGALLGVVPGCLGGFAAVSLYSHGMFSLGALVAAMVSSSGDEAFVMLAMIPKEAVLLFGILFALALLCGLLTDLIFKDERFLRKVMGRSVCKAQFEIHHEHIGESVKLFRASSYRGMKHPSAERLAILGLVLVFVVAVFSGILEHSHGGDVAEHIHEHIHEGFNILDERWMNILFACLSVVLMFFVAASPEHFLKDHIWGHVIRHHAVRIFLWTAGAMTVMTVGLHYLDIEPWLNENAYVLLLLAALIGMIPESGPHMIFITLFAGGLVPLSVLLTSCISQDGHTSLPLIAASKKSFLVTKLINAVFAVAVGSVFYLLGF